MLLNGASHQPEWAEEQAAYPVPPEVIETDLTTPTASFLKPSPSYMAPNLSMLLGLSGDDSVENMPPFSIASRILQQYWASVHPVARILHRPSFERRWQTFAHDLQTKTRPAKSLSAIVFAVLLSGITAMPPGTIDREFGEDQYLWQQKLKTGTEQALVQAQMLQTAKLETLQAFVAYLVWNKPFSIQALVRKARRMVTRALQRQFIVSLPIYEPGTNQIAVAGHVVPVRDISNTFVTCRCCHSCC